MLLAIQYIQAYMTQAMQRSHRCPQGLLVRLNLSLKGRALDLSGRKPDHNA
jgi:hypothetical protein